MTARSTYRSVRAGLTALAAALVFATGSVSAQSYSEYEVKAAYLFNFAKFVSWPDGAFRNDNAPIILAVIGDDPFGEVLEKTTRGRTVNGRPWVIKRYKTVAEIGECHILFVSKSERASVRQILEAVKGKPVLTISDEVEEFCQLGGIINFSSRQMKYGFQINKVTADEKNIRISSKLLALAKIIKPYGY